MTSAPRIETIDGTNFGSFEGFHLVLPETGLVLLKGFNEDTGGSSASGKSTLILGMNYPIGTCDVPATELQTWDCEIPPFVVGMYRIDGKTVEIGRGKRFTLKKDGVAFTGSAAQKEEEIDRLFGMDAEMRRALTYRGQRKPGLFLSKTDAEKKTFLTKLLGLDTFEEAAEVGKLNVDKLAEAEKMEVAREADLQARIDQEGPKPDIEEYSKYMKSVANDATLLAGEVAELEVHMGRFRKDASRAYESYTHQRNPEVRGLSEQLEQLESVTIEQPQPSNEYLRASYTVTEFGTRIERLGAEDRVRRTEIDAQRTTLNQDLQAMSLRLGAKNGVLADKDRIMAELKILARDVCPVCSREWDRAQIRREKLNEDLAVIEAKLGDFADMELGIEELKAELERTPKFEPNPMIEAMRKAQAFAQTQVAQERQKLDSEVELKTIALEKAKAELRASIAQLEREIEGTARQAEANILREVDDLRAFRDQKKEYLQISNQALVEAKRMVADSEITLTRIDNLSVQKAAISAKLAEIRVAFAAEADFLHLIGREGFLGAIFDEVLAEISDETNQVLASIANTRNCTIQFTSESLTKKGTINREIVPVVTINGHKASLRFGPSGGMLSAIELAVDLAVGHVISRRTGVCPGWLILDESFDGLGPVEKETCLEILTKYSQDRLVIVVDHATEMQGLFTKKLQVKYKNGVSILV
jgi:DNA repair exonuclease SbcCD ATPase subunit